MDSTPEMTKRKLLLADDSVTIRKVVELTFAEEGIEVISAADGDAAMQKFVEQTPDIVLVDVEMPGQNGYQICEMIKADESTRNIPVLLLVGSFEPFDQTEAERVQADGFLTKPFHSIRELVGRVKELMDDASDAAGPSPDTEDIEHLYSSSLAATVPLDEEETEEDLGEASFDDEMVETVQPATSYMDNGFNDTISTAKTIQGTVKDFDWSPSEKVEDEVAEEVQVEAVAAVGTENVKFSMAEDTAVDTEIHDSKADTEEIASPFVTSFEPPASTEIPGVTRDVDGEPSEEMIALIAKRVVEKLSDRVIRDIAQEAVPRIAEKLIREALDEENKS